LKNERFLTKKSIYFLADFVKRGHIMTHNETSFYDRLALWFTKALRGSLRRDKFLINRFLEKAQFLRTKNKNDIFLQYLVIRRNKKNV